MINIKGYQLYILLYFLISLITYFVFIDGNYYKKYEEGTTLRLDADATRYIDVAENFHSLSLENLTSFSTNFLGPVLILHFLDFNHFAVFLFNISILFLSTYIVTSSFKIEKKIFYRYLLINPMTFFSLLTIGKEIQAISCILVLVAFHYSTKKIKWLYLLLAITFAILTRWQFVAIIIIYLIIVKKNIINSHINRWLIIFVLLVCLSYVLGYFSNITQDVIDFAETGVINKRNSVLNLNNLFIEMQNRYLYWLIFIPKALYLTFFPAIAFFTYPLFSPNFKIVGDFYNIIIIPFSSLVNLILFIKYFKKEKISIKNDMDFLTMIVIMIFAVVPFSNYRYFFPLYGILCVEYCRTNKKKI